MSYKWWNSTDTLLLASLFNMVSREFFGAQHSFMSSRAGGGKVWKEQERDIQAKLWLPGACGKQQEKEGAAVGALQHPGGCHHGNRPRASPTTGTERERERERERGMGWGDRDNHMRGVNCYKYQESNQYVKMCVPLFTYMRHVNEKRGEREEELERKRRDY